MNRFRRVGRQMVIHLKYYISTHPRLKVLSLQCLAPFPRLKMRLKLVGSQPMTASAIFTIKGPKQLSPRARQIYHDLKTAIEQHQKGQQ